MAELVRELLESGETPEVLGELLGMEDEEVERLADRAGVPTRISREKTEFSQGWVP